MDINQDDLVWTLLDAPRLEPSNWELFWEKWHRHAGASYINKADPMGNQDSGYAATGKRTEYFKGLNLYAKDPRMLNEGHWQLPYLSYTEIFPNLLDDVAQACPWVSEVLVARLWQSTMPIPMHRDHTLEDVALRAMIYDENPSPTFKVYKPGGGMHYVDLPADGPNWFAYNNKICMHGSDKVDGINKIILLLVHRCDDKSKMLDHFRISAERHPGRYVYQH
jgi:hypothetical protein